MGRDQDDQPKKQRGPGRGKRGAGRPPSLTFVYVPETFDPETVLPEELRRYADCARYFLHRVIWGRVMRDLTEDQFTLLKFDYLRAVIPDRVLKPLKEALTGKVVECDGRYIEGRKSYGYRLLPPHSESRIVRTALADEGTVKKVRGHRQAESKKVRLDVHRYLRTQFRRLEVDLPLARSLLARHPDYELVKLPVEQIARKDLHFTVCGQGRVHTDLTRCPRRVRDALHVRGEPLVGIDIANSQPLFLALLLINYRKHGNNAFAYVTFSDQKVNPYKDVDEIIARTVSHFQVEEESLPSPPLGASITTRREEADNRETPLCKGFREFNSVPDLGTINRDFLQKDEQYFVRLCEQGRLYEALMERTERTVRRWVKEDFFEVLYGKNSLRSPLKAEFTEMFPNVAGVVRAHKKKDHAFLPRLMQKVEANFMVNTVCRRLMVEIPEAPVFTIHDSILTTEPFAARVQEVMREEFSRLGLSPTLHVKKYGHAPAPVDG